MPKFWLRALRLFSVLDGASFVYLLFHAIYSKRIMGNADAIHTPGMLHGVIFCGLIAVLMVASIQLKWPTRRAAWVVLCAFLPFAPFFLEISLKREQLALESATQ